MKRFQVLTVIVVVALLSPLTAQEQQARWYGSDYFDALRSAHRSGPQMTIEDIASICCAINVAGNDYVAADNVFMIVDALLTKIEECEGREDTVSVHEWITIRDTIPGKPWWKSLPVDSIGSGPRVGDTIYRP